MNEPMRYRRFSIVAGFLIDLLLVAATLLLLYIIPYTKWIIINPILLITVSTFLIYTVVRPIIRSESPGLAATLVNRALEDPKLGFMYIGNILAAVSIVFLVLGFWTMGFLPGWMVVVGLGSIFSFPLFFYPSIKSSTVRFFVIITYLMLLGMFLFVKFVLFRL